jgi:hypothetical protein
MGKTGVILSQVSMSGKIEVIGFCVVFSPFKGIVII